MKLSDFFDNSEILRNNEFEYFAILDSKTNLQCLSYLDDIKYIDKIIGKQNITAVLTTEEIGNILLNKTDKGIVILETPRSAFFKLHNKLKDDGAYSRSSYPTKIGKSCSISPLSCISSTNVVIGNNVIIEEFVSIKENTIIDDDCIIRAGTIIGGCGFEFKGKQDDIFRVEHLGGVHLHSNVEVQYNCTIDKAVFPWDDTVIGMNTKFDNLVHIGHAAKIGRNVLFPAGTTVSGRVELGNNVWIGVGSVLSNGISFGDNSRCNIGSVVTKSVGSEGNVTGNFAIDHKKFLENLKKVR